MMQVLSFFISLLALLFSLFFSSRFFCFSGNVRFLFSGMFVWLARKSRARGLWGFFFFVACAGGGGCIERPMAWCISLFLKKLKNENPKKKILKIEKLKIQNLKKEKLENRQVMLSCLYNLRVFL